jgi:hypothetical protein
MSVLEDVVLVATCEDLVVNGVLVLNVEVVVAGVGRTPDELLVSHEEVVLITTDETRDVVERTREVVEMLEPGLEVVPEETTTLLLV